MFFKRGGARKRCLHRTKWRLACINCQFTALNSSYYCRNTDVSSIPLIVGQLRLESQGSNRIGYVTELLATEHHRNSDGARVLTPTQECKQCALIQLNKWTLCFESMSLQISLQSFRHCAGSVEQLLHWLVFISQEALLVLSIIIICYYRQEKAFWDWISIAIFKS